MDANAADTGAALEKDQHAGTSASSPVPAVSIGAPPILPGRTRHRSGRSTPTVAALDLGTNNCRLLVARPAQDGFRVVDAFSRIVRLGEGLGCTGALSPAAMERTLAALTICVGKMRRRGVTHSRAVATEACRRAVNFSAFRTLVADRLGLDLEVISAEEEARLALQGCAPLLNPGTPYALMFDIGGGSTEIMWMRTDTARGHAWPRVCPALIDSVSLPLGVVSFSELHGGEAVTAEGYAAMVATTRQAIAGIEQRNAIGAHISRGEVQMLGSSGTVTTLAGVALDLPRYDRALVDGTFLDFDTARRISQDLLQSSYDRRCAHPCIGRQRGDLVLAGCAILEALLDLWPVGRLRIADRGVREGILFDLCTAARKA